MIEHELIDVLEGKVAALEAERERLRFLLNQAGWMITHSQPPRDMIQARVALLANMLSVLGRRPSEAHDESAAFGPDGLAQGVTHE